MKNKPQILARCSSKASDFSSVISRSLPAGNVFTDIVYCGKYDLSLGETKKYLHTVPPLSFDLTSATGLRRIMSSQRRKMGQNFRLK